MAARDRSRAPERDDTVVPAQKIAASADAEGIQWRRGPSGVLYNVELDHPDAFDRLRASASLVRGDLVVE